MPGYLTTHDFSIQFQDLSFFPTNNTIKISQSLWILNFDMNSTHPQGPPPRNIHPWRIPELFSGHRRSPPTRLYQHNKDVTQRLHDRLEGRRMPWSSGKVRNVERCMGRLSQDILKGWLKKRNGRGPTGHFQKGKFPRRTTTSQRQQWRQWRQRQRQRQEERRRRRTTRRRKRKMKSSQSSKGDREQVYRCAVPVVDAFSAIPTTWGPKLLCHQSCWPAWYFSHVRGSIWIQQWEKLWITIDLCVQIVLKELKTIQKPLEISSIFTLLWYCFTKITPTFWAPPRYHRHIHIPFSLTQSLESHLWSQQGLATRSCPTKRGTKDWILTQRHAQKSQRIGNTMNDHDAYLFIAAFKNWI